MFIYIKAVSSTPVPGNYTLIPQNQPGSSDNSVIRYDGHARLLKEVLHLKVVSKEQGETLSSILSALNCILDRLPPSQAAVPSATTAFPFSLPLQTLEELMSLCEKIAQIGGSNLGNCVRRMLAKLVNNKVAACFSWLGNKGKESFSSLKISSVLFSAIRRNQSFNIWSDRDIEVIIKDWLRHAKARCKD